MGALKLLQSSPWPWGTCLLSGTFPLFLFFFFLARIKLSFIVNHQDNLEGQFGGGLKLPNPNRAFDNCNDGKDSFFF